MTYGTTCETDFIDDIGCHSLHGDDLSRKGWLKLYRKSIEKRVRWGGINRETVFAYLAAAESRCPPS